jgi:hypothetical protein
MMRPETKEVKMKREITWATGDGREARVAVELITSKTTDADGDKITVDCCEIEITAAVNGDIIGTGRPVKASHPVAVAKIGKLGINAANLARINAAIAEIEATPEWIAKVARMEASNKAANEYRDHADKMRRIMGR